MKRAQKPLDLIERPALVHDSMSGEVFELDSAPKEVKRRLAEKAARVWYQAAALAVKDELKIDFEIRYVESTD